MSSSSSTVGAQFDPLNVDLAGNAVEGEGEGDALHGVDGAGGLVNGKAFDGDSDGDTAFHRVFASRGGVGCAPPAGKVGRRAGHEGLPASNRSGVR